MGDGRKKGTELSSSCLTDHPPIPHGKRQRHHGFLQDKSQTVPPLPLPSSPAGHGYGGGGTDFPIKIGAFFERGSERVYIGGGAVLCTLESPHPSSGVGQDFGGGTVGLG